MMYVPQLLKFWLMHILISAQLVLAALSHCHGYGFLQEVCASRLFFHIYTWNPFLLNWSSRVTCSADLNSWQAVSISMTEVWSNNVPFTIICLRSLILFIEYNLEHYWWCHKWKQLVRTRWKIIFLCHRACGRQHTCLWQSSALINLFPLSFFLSFFLRSAPQCSFPISLLSLTHIGSFGMKWCIQCYKKSVTLDNLLTPWNLRQDFCRYYKSVVH